MESSVKPAENSSAQNQAEPAPPAQETEALREKIVNTLRSIYDPEIPVNIYEIGLIYSVEIDPANAVNIRMTLTSPACPAAGIEGVTDVKVDLVWDPTWSPAMMSETAKLQLGML